MLKEKEKGKTLTTGRCICMAHRMEKTDELHKQVERQVRTKHKF